MSVRLFVYLFVASNACCCSWHVCWPRGPRVSQMFSPRDIYAIAAGANSWRLLIRGVQGNGSSHGNWIPMEFPRELGTGFEYGWEWEWDHNMGVGTVNAFGVPKSFPRISKITLRYSLCSLFATFTQRLIVTCDLSLSSVTQWYILC